MPIPLGLLEGLQTPPLNHRSGNIPGFIAEMGDRRDFQLGQPQL